MLITSKKDGVMTAMRMIGLFEEESTTEEAYCDDAAKEKIANLIGPQTCMAKVHKVNLVSNGDMTASITYFSKERLWYGSLGNSLPHIEGIFLEEDGYAPELKGIDVSQIEAALCVIDNMSEADYVRLKDIVYKM